MTDLKALKRANSIHQVITECGIPLVQDQAAGIWRGRDDRSLEVNAELGRFAWGDKKGDVLDFLMDHFGWSFGQAINYLRNRGQLPAGTVITPAPEGDHLAGQGGNGAFEWGELAGEDLAKLVLDDWRVREALELGRDYPRDGFAHFVGRTDWISFIHEYQWLPYEFIPVIGFLFDNFCEMCYCDLSEWQDEGKAFRGLEAIGDSVVISPEVYCGECCQRVLRWRRGFDLLIDWAQGEERRQRKIQEKQLVGEGEME
jgi:hypothetical protein